MLKKGVVSRLDYCAYTNPWILFPVTALHHPVAYKPGTHQTDANELAVMKADCVASRHLRRGERLHLNTPRGLHQTVGRHVHPAPAFKAVYFSRYIRQTVNKAARANRFEYHSC